LIALASKQIHSFPKHMLCSPFFLLAKVLPKREKKIKYLKMKREIGGLPSLKGRKLLKITGFL
jgi:hypothetical protein